MNKSIVYDLSDSFLPLTAQLRDLDVLRAVCRQHGWEFRAGQRMFRWFGRRLGPDSPPGQARCDHAIGIPGCRDEIGLVCRGEHYVPVWDASSPRGIDTLLGPAGRLLWRAYVIEKVQREAPAHGHTVSTHTDARLTLRVRIAEPASQRSAHVRMRADSDTTLWTLRPGAAEVFRYLVDALGEVRTDGETAHDPVPA